jgi:hypothetical protein
MTENLSPRYLKTPLRPSEGHRNCNIQNANLFDPYQPPEKHTVFRERFHLALSLCATCPAKKTCEEDAEQFGAQGTAAGKYYGPLHKNILGVVPHTLRAQTPLKENIITWQDITGDKTPWHTLRRELGSQAYPATTEYLTQKWTAQLQKYFTAITVTSEGIEGAHPHDIPAIREKIYATLAALFDLDPVFTDIPERKVLWTRES